MRLCRIHSNRPNPRTQSLLLLCISIAVVRNFVRFTETPAHPNQPRLIPRGVYGLGMVCVVDLSTSQTLGCEADATLRVWVDHILHFFGKLGGSSPSCQGRVHRILNPAL